MLDPSSDAGRASGDAGRPAPRPDRDPPLRRDGLAARSSAPATASSPTTPAGTASSDPAPSPTPTATTALADDLARVLDERGIDRAVLAGASMGAHTLLRFALEHPERVAGLVVITPAYDPRDFGDAATSSAGTRWPTGLRDRRRRGLRRGLRRPGRARGVARHGLTRHPPAPGRARAPRRASPTRCGRCRARGRSRRSTTSRAIDGADGRRGRPRRGRPRPPARVGEALRGAIPGAELRRRGGGQVAARLAGQPALEGHRRTRGAGDGVSAAGYSGTPLPKKLGFKPGSRVAYVDAPDGFDALLGELPDGVTVRRQLRGPLDLVVLLRDRARATSSGGCRRCARRSRPTGCCGSRGRSGRRASRPT